MRAQRRCAAGAPRRCARSSRGSGPRSARRGPEVSCAPGAGARAGIAGPRAGTGRRRRFRAGRRNRGTGHRDDLPRAHRAIRVPCRPGIRHAPWSSLPGRGRRTRAGRRRAVAAVRVVVPARSNCLHMARGIAQGRAPAGGAGRWRPGLAAVPAAVCLTRHRCLAAVAQARLVALARAAHLRLWRGRPSRPLAPRVGDRRQCRLDGIHADPPFRRARKTGSEASDWCAFALVTLADRVIGSAPSARRPPPP
jgi:hypothetical protein